MPGDGPIAHAWGAASAPPGGRARRPLPSVAARRSLRGRAGAGRAPEMRTAAPSAAPPALRTRRFRRPSVTAPTTFGDALPRCAWAGDMDMANKAATGKARCDREGNAHGIAVAADRPSAPDRPRGGASQGSAFSSRLSRGFLAARPFPTRGGHPTAPFPTDGSFRRLGRSLSGGAAGRLSGVLAAASAVFAEDRAFVPRPGHRRGRKNGGAPSSGPIGRTGSRG